MNSVVEFVAHRAGNHPEEAVRAAELVDTVEFDVHRFRGRLEVRHEKVLWPTRVQWERWTVDLRPPQPPELAESLRRLPAGTTAWLDLKGFSTSMTETVLRSVPADRSIVVSSRSWWTLRPGRQRRIRNLRSVGSRTQLLALGLVRRWSPCDGIGVHERLLRPGVLDRLLELTDDIAAWGVTDVDRAVELVDAGVGSLILDDLTMVADIRRRARRR